MKLALIAKSTDPWDPDGFLFETALLWADMAGQHPEHDFFLLSGFSQVPLVFPQNLRWREVKASGTSSLLRPLAFRNFLARSLREIQPCILIAAGNRLPRTLRNCACWILPDRVTGHLESAPTLVKVRGISRSLTDYMELGGLVITRSGSARNEVEKMTGLGNRVRVLGYGAEGYGEPTDPGLRESLKRDYAEGREYFLYIGLDTSEAGIHLLLKGFSVFKKKFHSQMKLLLVCSSPGTVGKQARELDSFRFRQDVRVLEPGSPGEAFRMLSGAYALILNEGNPGSVRWMIRAFEAGVPVLSSGQGALGETGKEKVLEVNPWTYENLGAQLGAIFKDERFRSRLVRETGLWAREHPGSLPAAGLWEILEKVPHPE